jgi:glycosyltransferase involved in cell wall biosynthesis
MSVHMAVVLWICHMRLRMRILYSHRVQSRDGQAVHIEEMVAALRGAGHEVRVVGPPSYAQSAFGGSNRSTDMLRRILPGLIGELAELAYNVPATCRLLRAWREFRPDFVYERYNLFHLAGSYLGRRHGALLFLEVNSPLAAERARHGGLSLKSLAYWIERFTWRSAARVLPVTQVLGDIVMKSGVEPNRITVVPNAIVPARYPPRETDSGRPVLGFIGFVRDWHGLDGVLDAMASDPVPLDLVVVGDGPALPALRQQAQALGLVKRVRFTGLAPHDQVPLLIMQFSIALQPRVTEYASPLKVFDYMAAGCAIVAPAQANIREVLTHEATALLFDPDHPASMWQAVRRLAADPVLRARLGHAARETALAEYTWAGNAQKIAALAALNSRGTKPVIGP